MPGGVFSSAKLFAMLIRESANDGSDFGTPDADYRFMFLGEDGHWHAKESADVVTDLSGLANPMTTAEDIIYGGASGTPTRKAVGAAGGALSVINGALAYNSGTSFPGSVVAGDRYWRTDRGLEYYYDGTRWLTTQLHVVTIGRNPINETVQPISQALSPQNTHRAVAPSDLYDLWVENCRFTIRVNTTNSGSHYWTLEFLSVGAAGASLGSANTSADAADTILRKTITVNALFGTTNTLIQTLLTKTGTPGTVDVLQCQYTFRFVG
jgi:hypothetical protein